MNNNNNKNKLHRCELVVYYFFPITLYWYILYVIIHVILFFLCLVPLCRYIVSPMYQDPIKADASWRRRHYGSIGNFPTASPVAVEHCRHIFQTYNNIIACNKMVPKCSIDNHVFIRCKQYTRRDYKIIIYCSFILWFNN